MSGIISGVIASIARGAVVASPVTFTTPGSFIVPAGVSSITVKIFGSGGQQTAVPSNAGSGAFIIGNYAVQYGDVIYAYNTGEGLSSASSVTWKRGVTVMGFAVAGGGGSGGSEGQDGGDGGQGAGGTGGNAGVLNAAASNGQSTDGGGGTGATTTSAGTGGAGDGNGANGSNGVGPLSSSGYSLPTLGGDGGVNLHVNGGKGGDGGGGYYSGGGGGGGYGRDVEPNSGGGGGGGGGGSSYESGDMTSMTNGLCVNSSDSNRGTAGNPSQLGKVVLVF